MVVVSKQNKRAVCVQGRDMLRQIFHVNNMPFFDSPLAIPLYEAMTWNRKVRLASRLADWRVSAKHLDLFQKLAG